MQGQPASSLEGVAPRWSTTPAAPRPALRSGAPIDAGTYTVVASFPGSTDYGSTRSTPVTFVIDKGTTTVAISSSGSPVVFGQSVSLVATVTAGIITPGGTVTFYDGTTLLGTVALPLGQCPAHHLGAGCRLALDHGRLRRRGGPPERNVEAIRGVDRHGRHPCCPGPAADFKKKKLASLKLEAEVLPALPGARRTHGDG